MSEANEIIFCDGIYEVHPMACGDNWGVVNGETGQVRSEFSDKQEAIDLATELNKVEIEDGIYILWPEGSSWISVTVEDGEITGKFEQSEFETHVAARDRFAKSGPSDDDTNVDDRGILKMIADYCGHDYLGCILEFRPAN